MQIAAMAQLLLRDTSLDASLSKIDGEALDRSQGAIPSD
jgi:hypothetical protein